MDSLKKMARKFSLISIIILLCLAACQVEPSPGTGSPTLEIINIQITPASAHWMNKVAQCSEQIPNFGVYRQILPVNELDLSNADLILRLGARQEKDPFVTVVGTEEIVLVAGENVPVTSLSLESVQAIFTDVHANWEQVPEAQGSSTEGNQLISTLSYPDGHELRNLFEKSFLNSDPIASNPTLFYSEEGIDELVKEDPLAIAYTLKSQVAPDFRTLNIISEKPQPGLQYVLAITPQEPKGYVLELLLCLQNTP